MKEQENNYNVKKYLISTVKRDVDNNGLRPHSILKLVFVCLILLCIYAISTLSHKDILSLIISLLSLLMFIFAMKDIKKTDYIWYRYRLFMYLSLDCGTISFLVGDSLPYGIQYSIIILAICFLGQLLVNAIIFRYQVNRIIDGKQSNENSDTFNSILVLALFGTGLGVFISNNVYPPVADCIMSGALAIISDIIIIKFITTYSLGIKYDPECVIFQSGSE